MGKSEERDLLHWVFLAESHGFLESVQIERRDRHFPTVVEDQERVQWSHWVLSRWVSCSLDLIVCLRWGRQQSSSSSKAEIIERERKMFVLFCLCLIHEGFIRCEYKHVKITWNWKVAANLSTISLFFSCGMERWTNQRERRNIWTKQRRRRRPTRARSVSWTIYKKNVLLFGSVVCSLLIKSWRNFDENAY